VKTNYPGGPPASLGQKKKAPLDEYEISINMDVPRRPADSTVLFVNGEPRYF